MSNQVEEALCPLCANDNYCAQFGISKGGTETTQNCWCQDPSYSFPQALINTLPESQRGQACICKACARRFHLDHE